jgi:hypothetical protein
MDMIIYFGFPGETPDGNDVLITNPPTSIPESDLHVARAVFWSRISMLCILYVCL